jgi:3-carboxy-cis,cis-muconate cycloisomerase
MPATALDSIIFRDIFSTAEMRRVFSDEQRTAYYLEIEAALARVQGRLGIIPQEAAREIERKCKVENIDFAKLKATTERIGYPILGVVQQIVALCEQGLGEWCHWGATTQDITDTATVMQIRAALDLVEADMEKVAAVLADLARCRSPSASRRRRCWRRCSVTVRGLRSFARASSSANSPVPPARCPRSAPRG